MWIMSSKVAIAVSVACILHLSLLIHSMKKVGQFFKRYENQPYDDDAYYAVERGSKEEYFKVYLKFSIRCFLHNFDMVSDLLYLITVPCSHPAIKVIMIISISIPAIFFFIGWLNDRKHVDDAGMRALTSYFGFFPLYMYRKGKD